ncbi:MAG: D-alanyl-D-alanine carboxypeptidase/D-alanyl-D-alanine-endopeptidase [Clostridia bacterium]
MELAQVSHTHNVQMEYRKLQELICELEQQGISVGIMVASLSRDPEKAILFAHDANRLMVPASNTKLVTSSAALRLLGEDYRYQTEIYTTGGVSDEGIVSGDLIVKGYGDPSIHSEGILKVHDGISIEQITASLLEFGITCIRGNVIVDDTYFDSQRRGEGWSWEYEAEYYSAQTSALAVNRGAVRIDYEADAEPGTSPRLMLTPQTAYVTIQNDARIVDASEPATLVFDRESGSNLIRVSGQVPRGTAPDFARIAVHEPALYFGTLLKECMERAGVRFAPSSRVVMGSLPPEAEMLLALSSGPLSKMVAQLNKSSDNHYAEMLLKTIGAVCLQQGTATAGLQAVCENLAELGVDCTFRFHDGSGLSRYNLIAAKHLVTLLESMTTQPVYQPFYESLPIAGVDGTLESRMRNGSGYANVRAKTGTLNGVSGLSGYLTTNHQEPCVFSILLNGYTGDTDDLKGYEDRIVTLLLELT